MRILITGGAGYIGSQMTLLCEDNNMEVFVFDNLSRGKNELIVNKDRFFLGDLANTREIENCLKESNPDVVMHFAAFAYVGESVENPNIYYSNNLIGTFNLIESMRKLGFTKLVFSSTCATYGVPDQFPISERTSQLPINPYGKTKLYIENMLSDYFTAYDFSSISFRYFNAAGCDEKGRVGEDHDPETHLIPLVLKEALRVKKGGDPKETTLSVYGDDYETEDGSCIRDYIHVEDICKAHLVGAKKLYNNEPMIENYNLSTGGGFSIFEVIKMCQEVTNTNIYYSIHPKRAGDPPKLIGDPTKANTKLQWKAEKSTLENIIKTSWNWILKNDKTT